MQSQPLPRLIVGLTGLYATVVALRLFPKFATLSVIAPSVPPGTIPVAIGLYGLLILLAVLMITRPDFVARFAWSGGGGTATVVAPGLTATLFGAAGAVILTGGLASLVAAIVGGGLSKEFLAVGVARLALGGWLLLRPAGVVQWWRRGQGPDEEARLAADRLGPVVVAVLGAIMATQALATVLPVAIGQLQGREGWSLLRVSGDVVELLVGSWFFFGAADVERFILRRAKAAE